MFILPLVKQHKCCMLAFQTLEVELILHPIQFWTVGSSSVPISEKAAAATITTTNTVHPS